MTASAERPARKATRAATRGKWQQMIRRCSDPRDDSYCRYGARGVSVCERWLASFDAFQEDMGRPIEGWEIDRIDNLRGYEPGNCRWVEREENNRNKRQRVQLDPEEAQAATAARSAAYIAGRLVSGRALEALRSRGTATARDIAADVGVSITQARSCLYSLRNRGLAECLGRINQPRPRVGSAPLAFRFVQRDQTVSVSPDETQRQPFDMSCSGGAQ
jgi:hypothetical protein